MEPARISTGSQSDVFLLHVWENGSVSDETIDIISELNASLSERLKVWFHKTCPGSDGNFIHKIRQGINNSSKVIFFLDVALAKRRPGSFVDIAIEYALSGKGPDDIILVVLEEDFLSLDDTQIPLRGNPIHIDMTTEISRRENLETIFKIVDASVDSVTKSETDVNVIVEGIEKGIYNFDEVLELMDMYIEEEVVQWKACQWISDLEPEKYADVEPVHVEIRNELEKRFASDKVLRAMRKHLHSSKVQAFGCLSVCHIARDEIYQDRLMQKGAAKDVMNAMDHQKQSADVQACACRAISNLAFFNFENVAILSRLEVIQKIIRAMDSHQRSVTVQQHTCAALGNLTYNSDSNRLTCVRLGAGYRIVRAMDAHQESPDVQRNACLALWNFSSNVENSKHFSELEAGRRVIWAISNYEEYAELVVNACAALWNLGYKNPNEKVALIRLDAGSAIIRAMDYHPENEALQVKACGALWSLAFGNVSNQLTLRNLGAIHQINKALENHPLSDTLKDRAEGAKDAILSG